MAPEDPEDNFPFLPPSLPPTPIEHFDEQSRGSEADTVGPPPMNFGSLTDSEKLHWLCKTVEHISDAQIVMSQNLSVLNARIGVIDGEDGEASIYQRGREIEGHVSILRSRLIDQGESINELNRAEARRHPTI